MQFDFGSKINHDFFSRNNLFSVASKTLNCLQYVQCYVSSADQKINDKLTAKIIDRIESMFPRHSTECIVFTKRFFLMFFKKAITLFWNTSNMSKTVVCFLDFTNFKNFLT